MYNTIMLVSIEKVSPLKVNEKGYLYGFSTRESKYLIIIDRKKGTISGDHYHTGKTKSKSPEIFYLVKGKVELSVKDMRSGEEEVHIIKANHKIEVPSNIHHKFTALTDIILLECNVDEEDFESDTVKN